MDYHYFFIGTARCNSVTSFKPFIFLYTQCKIWNILSIIGRQQDIKTCETQQKHKLNTLAPAILLPFNTDDTVLCALPLNNLT